MSTTSKGTLGARPTFKDTPATEIVIPTGYLVDLSNEDSDLNESFTIPNGVKVIEVHASAYITDYTSHIINLYVYSSGGLWIFKQNERDAFHTVYVGVTPNKNYYVHAYAETREGEDCTIDRFYIKYSPEINKQTPTVTDY